MKNVECEVKFDFENDHFLRPIFSKYDVKKLNILRSVPMTTLRDRTADIFLYFGLAVAGRTGSSGVTF